VVDPNPELPEVQEAYEKGAIRSFARHSRLGGTNLGSVELVREDFMKSVDYLRSLGFKRISLKTGSYGMEELAMAIKFASDAKNGPAHHRRLRRRHRHEPLEHDAELGGAVH
jgi:hypothetical protein